MDSKELRTCVGFLHTLSELVVQSSMDYNDLNLYHSMDKNELTLYHSMGKNELSCMYTPGTVNYTYADSQREWNGKKCS